MEAADLGEQPGKERHAREVVEVEQVGAQPVVEVVGVVGDVVGERATWASGPAWLARSRGLRAS